MTRFIYCCKDEIYLNVSLIHHFRLDEDKDSNGNEMWVLKIHDVEGVVYEGPTFATFIEADEWLEETFDIE